MRHIYWVEQFLIITGILVCLTATILFAECDATTRHDTHHHQGHDYTGATCNDRLEPPPGVWIATGDEMVVEGHADTPYCPYEGCCPSRNRYGPCGVPARAGVCDQYYYTYTNWATYQCNGAICDGANDVSHDVIASRYVATTDDCVAPPE